MVNLPLRRLSSGAGLPHVVNVGLNHWLFVSFCSQKELFFFLLFFATEKELFSPISPSTLCQARYDRYHSPRFYLELLSLLPTKY
jgi:hypothetical protein